VYTPFPAGISVEPGAAVTNVPAEFIVQDRRLEAEGRRENPGTKMFQPVNLTIEHSAITV
jgi:hypothetical protein